MQVKKKRKQFLCYRQGYGIKIDYEKAYEYHQLAVKNGLNIALYNLAECYENGIAGTQKDNSKAFELYKESAEKGFIPSQYRLAKIHESKVMP